MKKQGFTLVELLLVLGIIAIIAAVAAPALGNLMPDKNKVKVLKTYKVINDLTQDLLHDPGIYECPKLSCGEAPQREDFDQAKGPAKFSYWFTQRMDIAKSYWEGISHSDFGTHKFTTKDGMYWFISVSNINGNIEILINVDGKEAQDSGKSCSYSSSCENPNQFKFVVDDNGNVWGNDPLTRAYLANPYKMNDKKNDFKAAKNDTETVIKSGTSNPYEDWIEHEKHLGDGIVQVN